MPENQRQPSSADVTLELQQCDIEIEGRISWSSNVTLLVRLHDELQAIYKPLEGERPLHDFPAGLYKREIAAYELAVALTWPNIPQTIARIDAPYGIGSLQRFVDADFSEHYFSLQERASEKPDDFEERAREIALFDVIANNADRKSGHVLASNDGAIYVIDHGLCFHEEAKLRTVIWDFIGEPISDRLLADAERVRNALPTTLANWLTPEETRALETRMDEVLQNRIYPEPTSEYPYPWPLI